MPPDLKFEDIINGILAFSKSLRFLEGFQGLKEAPVTVMHRKNQRPQSYERQSYPD
jgi:hypothetical protein